jgi:hypothetical protein
MVDNGNGPLSLYSFPLIECVIWQTAESFLDRWLLDRKGLMGCLSLSVSVCLSVCMSHLYCSTCKTWCPKGIKETSRKLEAVAKQALMTSLYIQSTVKRSLRNFTFTDKPVSCEAVDNVLSCPSGRSDTFRMLGSNFENCYYVYAWLLQAN